jgi:ammonium transporter Rh
LVNGDFAAGAVLISFGAVLGKVTPTQLIWMTFIEVIFYAINEYILYSRLEVLDAGGSMVIHTFGAFFGLALSLMMGIPSKQDQKHNTSRYTSDIFSMIGTLFLWMYWPSFNGALVPSDGFRQERAVTNTLLSIAASCVTAFVFTVLLSASKKFELVHLQNATLAGGVAMGATCELAINPASAITIGIVAGAISVGGYTNFLGYFEHTIKLSDTAGILNLHGMPGVLGGLAAGFATLAVPNEKYGSKVAILSMYPSHMTRSIGTQAGYQFLGILITLGISIISGVLTGIFLRSKRFFRQQEQKYQDEEWFHVPEGFCMANVRVITSHTDSQDLEEHPQYLSIQSPRDACINAVALDIASTN